MLKEYKRWAEVHLKELAEYKASFYIYLFNNVVYALSQLFVVVFFVRYTELIEMHKALLVMLTSWLIFDISKIFTYAEGFYYSNYFLFIARPGNERMATISNVWNRVPLIIIEILVLIFALHYYRLSVSLKEVFGYGLLVLLGVVVFTHLYNTLEVLGAAIFKSDRHGLRYILMDVQDVFLKYPYVLFRNQRFVWTVAMVFLTPLYTYNPASMLWAFSWSRLLIELSVGVAIALMLRVVFIYTYSVFSKVYEVYGG